MQLFNWLSLKQKLFLTAFFPLLILTWFSVDKILMGYENERKLGVVRQKTSEIHLMSVVVHEIQKERDYSVLYINNPIFEIQSKLVGQINQSDSIVRSIKIDALQSHLDTNFFKEFRDIKEVRSKISWFQMSSEEVDVYYSNVIEQLIERIASIATASGIEKQMKPCVPTFH